MHCRVHYLFDFDLKIRSGQVCNKEVLQNVSQEMLESQHGQESSLCCHSLRKSSLSCFSSTTIRIVPLKTKFNKWHHNKWGLSNWSPSKWDISKRRWSYTPVHFILKHDKDVWQNISQQVVESQHGQERSLCCHLWRKGSVSFFEYSNQNWTAQNKVQQMTPQQMGPQNWDPIKLSKGRWHYTPVHFNL